MIYATAVYDLRVPSIPDLEIVEGWMRSAIKKMGLTTMEVSSAVFPGNDKSYTIAAILAESHIILHTCPEEDWVEISIAVCRNIDWDRLELIIRELFRPSKVKVQRLLGSVPS